MNSPRLKAFIARIVVERVLKDVFGARVLFTADGKAVAPGDRAATRLE